MNTTLSGQTALITGSTRGIGRAIAELLAKMGARVILSGRDAERGSEVTDAIRAAGGSADFISADLTSMHSVRELVRQANDLAGPVDVLINNAGVYPFTPTTDVTVEEFDSVYAANVRAPFFLVKALAPPMAARGGGAIVNLSTFAATKGIAGSSVYSSSKASVETLTKVWAAEFGANGVRINAVSPGPVTTEGTSGFGDDLTQQAAGSATGRVADPDEIASVVAFLLSDGARHIQGAIVPVDGGLRNS
jgi:NAD(P)-dependent dehydrogenase (short-subunit alcohol dehydrogenase family)